MRRVVYSTKSIKSETALEEVENYENQYADEYDTVDAASAADYMLQEERDMREYRIPCDISELPEEMSFREFCYEFYSVVPDDLTDEDYDSLYAKYDHYYDGWELRPEFK